MPALSRAVAMAGAVILNFEAFADKNSRDLFVEGSAGDQAG